MTSSGAARIADLLAGWIARQVSEAATAWLREVRAGVTEAKADRDLFLAIALVPRKIGRTALSLDGDDVELAHRMRPGWRPDLWSTDEAARICLLLTSPADPATFAGRLDRLSAAADVGELVAYHRGLPLYPDPSRHVARAKEGVRSNMRSVFEAVAHHNPYPAAHFPESAWNQMVLKALFIGSSLDPIQGLDARCNPALARMLCDYAHERWAAQRPVSPELWRCVGPCADEAALADLERLVQTPEADSHRAAALALRSCPHPKAQRLLEQLPEAERRGSWADLTGR